MSRKKDIWNEFESTASGKRGRAKCNHCNTEINKNIPTLHNHLTTKHPSIAVKYDHNGNKNKVQVESKAIWAEFQLTNSSSRSSKMIAKCNHCTAEIDTRISSLTSHLSQNHSTIYRKYDCHGNKAYQISIHASNYKSTRSTYVSSHSYFSSFRHYNYNTKSYQFFDTLWKQCKQQHKLPLMRKEFKALADQIKISNRCISSWNAYDILRSWGCRRKIAQFADSYMNGIGLSLNDFCNHIIKQCKNIEKLLQNRDKRNKLNGQYPSNDTDGEADSDSENDIILTEGDLSSLILQSDGSYKLKLLTKKLNTSPSAVRKFALFRLGSDLNECIKYPLPMIAAMPINDGDNMFEWHANLCGPPQSNYEDIAFHFIIRIPENYPQSAPKINICSYFEHPNVFGRKICLDMLQGEWTPNDHKKESHKDVGYGWTPAYTIQSILVQLQAFLFDAVDTTYWSKKLDEWGCTSTTMKSRKTAKFFYCKQCRHTGINPWPKPQCWNNRWKYMIPQIEMYDIFETKKELIKFLKCINDLCVLNEWYKIKPLKEGTFFNWSLCPWYCPMQYYIKELKSKNGTKSMLKRHTKVIRGLIYRTKEWLDQKPSPSPNKALYLLKMYQIESAMDIALGLSFNNSSNMKERGYWSWYNECVSSMDDDDDDDDDEKKQNETNMKKSWIKFSTNISLQIEALYLRYKSAVNRGKFRNWFSYWFPMKQHKVYYKAYVKDKNNTHFVIDIRNMQCRNVEKAKIYKITRNIQQRKANEIWSELLNLSNGGDEALNFDIGNKKKAKIVPFPVINYKKYIGQCAFIDLSFGNLPPTDHENDNKNEEMQNDTKDKIEQETKKDIIVIEKRDILPKMGEKVSGKIVKIIRYGMFIDIGGKNDAFLHISEIKCPKYIIDNILEEYFFNKEEKRKQKELYEQMKLKELKKKKRQRRKNKKKNKDKNKHKNNDDNKSVKENVRNYSNDNKTQNRFAIEEKQNDYINREYKEKQFILPRSAAYMNDISIKIGDIFSNLYVYDIDAPIEKISLTQFIPLTNLKIGDKITGYVRSIVSFAAFIDIGCEVDAFLHKTSLEAAMKNKIVFDCRENIEIGTKLDLIVNNIDLNKNKIQVEINTDIDNLDLYDCLNDKLLLPDDFDESLAVYKSIYGILSDDINDLIFQFLDRSSLHRCRKVCKLFERIIDDKTGLRFEIEELKCFHTKKTFRNEILGFGVSVERYPNTAFICDIEPKLNLLSWKSYQAYDIRTSVWKEPFSHWLPVYINKTHGKKAIIYAKKMLIEIVNDSKYINKLNDFSPYYVLKIIPTLMNTMVVRVMKGKLHESIVALEGYTMFYHLMLSFIIEYPFLQDFIDKNLGDFIAQMDNNIYRNKKHVSSLGEWIALLSTSNKYSWRDVCTSYLRECFDRNAKWILKSHNQLLDEKHPKQSRLRKSFLGCHVSLKLCMFHVLFLRLFRYSARSGKLQNTQQVKEKLDGLYGRPTYNMRELLQKNVKRIKKIKTWKEFFNGIGVKCPSDNELYEWLIESIRNSEKKGYHKRYWYIKKIKKKQDKTMGGVFDKFDDMGEQWNSKQFGSSAQKIKGKKKKKLTLSDQIIAGF